MNQRNKVEGVKAENLCSTQSNNETRTRFCKNRNILCPQLQSLNISFCNLSEVPKIIFNLTHLTQLNLSNNYLKVLPNEIGNLHNVLVLNLKENELSSLPDSVKYMHNLNSLDISCNNFCSIPDVLYNSLGVLKVLDLSFNKINNFNCIPQCIHTLTVLKLSFNRLINLPKWIFNSLCHLRELDIGGNFIFLDIQINDFCTATVFESLQFLNIENCNLSCEKIQFLSQFKNLRVLCLGNKRNSSMEKFQNYLGNLKMEILKNLKILKYLHMQYAQISTLPLGFGCMKNLEILDLSGNLLSWLPECFCDLVSLKILNLMSNQLLFLPNNIHKLVNLQELHLGNNNLCFLPDGIYNLSNLEYIDFYNNKIEEIDLVIFKIEKLKGIDLEVNCLQQYFFEPVKKQYECFKNSLRQHFNYVNSRFDEQDPKTSSEDESCSFYSLNLSYCSDSLSDCEDLVVSTPQIHYQDDFKEENWEEEIIGVKEDDLFNPNEICANKVLENYEEEWNFKFRNNYCPAYSHIPSLRETYAKNIESTLEDKFVDGQFDSD